MTEQWKKYEAMTTYNSTFKPNKNYYESIKVWYKFYEGDQWIFEGSEDMDLPQPTFNICKRIPDFKIASLTTTDIAINIEPLENVEIDDEEDNVNDTDFINAEIRNLFEKNRFRVKIKDVLRDGAITGDMCLHQIFDMSKKPYRGKYPDVKGEIVYELIDATNVGFGNANTKDVQSQPYIVIVGRDTVKNLKREAELVAKLKGLDIKSDNSTDYQASEFADIEIEPDDKENGKALYIYIYEKKVDENGEEKIFVSKITKDVEIYKDVDTGLTRYPIAFQNWYSQKNTYHGRGEIEGICTNQMAINKMFAMVIYHLMKTSFPPQVYDKGKIEKPSNRIGAIIGVDKLSPGERITDVMANLQAGDISQSVVNVIELLYQYTKENLGVSDASLGNIDPKNTSAIIAVQKSNAIPLENIKDNLYDFVEQVVLNTIDMMAAKYGERPVITAKEEKRELVTYDFSKLKGLDLKTNIDIGESTYYSEIAMVQTLDNLLNGQWIEFMDYLERLPNDLFPKKAEFISNLKKQVNDNQFKYKLMAQFMDRLPPEEQARLKSLPPEQMEQELTKMIEQVA